ncbi:MAG: hypothetical protein H6506_05070 [Calditrichaeota bacterium]|nr:hypothetical protein [Calditrichota bacterium]MCB9392007.1 hypothetical protein [Calditrichota bacterium]
MHLRNSLGQSARLTVSFARSAALWVALLAATLLAQTTLHAQTADDALQRLVTIDADDAFLPSVLAILAAESGFNIVTGPQVNQEERISIHLKDTPIEQAMNLVVRAAGLSYEIVGKSFLVAPRDQLREQVGLNAYVVELQYVEAPVVRKMLEKLNADITVDSIGNKLLVVTSPKVLADIQRIVSDVDVPPLQIVLECRMIEVGVENEEALGLDWNRLASIQTVVSEMPTNALGNPVDQDGNPDLTGIDPSIRGKVPSQLPFYPMETRRVGYWAKQATAFELALDMLLRSGRAEVLANTSVATLNNKTASIQVVDEIPYVARSGGVGGQVQIDRAIVGVLLNVTPKINSDGYITTDIQPELSSIFQFLESSDSQVPWVKRRRSSTTIRVKDGETVVIGGLLGVESSKTEHRFPFLGDIPFIGSLFRHKTTSTRKTDLIIQVTPHIIGTGYSLTLPERVKDVEERFMPQESGEKQE